MNVEETLRHPTNFVVERCNKLCRPLLALYHQLLTGFCMCSLLFNTHGSMEAFVQPLPKEPNLDRFLPKNYWPISRMSFILRFQIKLLRTSSLLSWLIIISLTNSRPVSAKNTLHRQLFLQCPMISWCLLILVPALSWCTVQLWYCGLLHVNRQA